MLVHDLAAHSFAACVSSPRAITSLQIAHQTVLCNEKGVPEILLSSSLMRSHVSFLVAFSVPRQPCSESLGIYMKLPRIICDAERRMPMLT
jgi:hypothetical protein